MAAEGSPASNRVGEWDNWDNTSDAAAEAVDATLLPVAITDMAPDGIEPVTDSTATPVAGGCEKDGANEALERDDISGKDAQIPALAGGRVEIRDPTSTPEPPTIPPMPLTLVCSAEDKAVDDGEDQNTLRCRQGEMKSIEIKESNVCVATPTVTATLAQIKAASLSFESHSTDDFI